VIGLASYWMVHDFPDKATFLTPEEKALALRRLKEDNQASADKEVFKMKYFWASCKDWKQWLYMVIYMGADCPLYAFSLFLPTISSSSLDTHPFPFPKLTSITVSSLGYTSTTANLLTVPPYALAAISTISIGYIADRTGQRALCNIFASFLGMAGFIMLIASQNNAVKYVGVFLGAAGIYPCIPNTVVWVRLSCLQNLPLLVY